MHLGGGGCDGFGVRTEEASRSATHIGSSKERASSECPMSSNAPVASLPASARSTSAPPGCSSRNSVTLYTLPAITIQQSDSVLCWASSDAVIVWAASVILAEGGAVVRGGGGKRGGRARKKWRPRLRGAAGGGQTGRATTPGRLPGGGQARPVAGECGAWLKAAGRVRDFTLRAPRARRPPPAVSRRRSRPTGPAAGGRGTGRVSAR